MDLYKYLMIRRAYNLVRQNSDAEQRLTFPEFALLCHLIDIGMSVPMSKLADYQDVLRPTMTHRIKRLRSLGYMEGTPGESDRRQTLCFVTDAGSQCTEELCQMCNELVRRGPKPLRPPLNRMRYYVDGMGTIDCDASDLVLLATKVLESERCILADIVHLLGLMQPTVSMTVTKLEKDGLLDRDMSNGQLRGSKILLTEKGQEYVDGLTDSISHISVPRKKSSVTD